MVQWNDRQRLTRRHGPFLFMLLRLALVLVTALAGAGLAAWWGPPMTYRLGEVYPYDLRIRAEFNVVNHVEFVNQQERSQRSDPPAGPVFRSTSG